MAKQKKNAQKPVSETGLPVRDEAPTGSSAPVSEASRKSSKTPLCIRVRELFRTPEFRKKAQKASLAFLFAALVAAGGVFGWKEYSRLYAIPEVSGANFSLEYRKIPFDVPSIDFVFSTDLDPATVTAANVTVTPSVGGAVSLKSPNVVSFALSEKLVVGSKYAFTLSKSIATPRGKTMARDVVIEIEAVAGVKVTRAIPTGETDKLSKNPVFIFNIPLVALSSLSEKDAAPCPVKFEPAVKGRCSWIAGNVLEYVLEAPLPASTKFAATISDSPGFLYPMKESFKTEFSTPVLSLSSVPTSEPQAFSPKDGIRIGFSSEARVEELEKRLEVREDLSGKTVPFRIVPESGASPDRAFRVFGKEGPLDHSTTYKVLLKDGLPSAYGNLAMPKGGELKARSNDFIRSVVVKYASYSETGALVDTPELPSEGKLIPVLPSKNAVLSMEFDEDVEFSDSAARLESEDGKFRYPCALSSYQSSFYVDGNEKKRTAFKCEVRSELPPGSAVRLIVSKDVSPSLKSDAVKDFTVAPKFEVSNFRVVSPTEACLYSTTPLRNAPESLVATPSAKVRELVPDGRYEWSGGDYRETFSCPKIEGKRAFVAAVRLNPETEYSFSFRKGAVDAYGSVLAADADLGKTKTGKISDKDRYLYSSATRDLNVVPAEARLVLGLRSVNVDSVALEACETDAAEYFRFTANSWRQNYSPRCAGASSKVSLPTKNLHWELSPKQVDVESEILGRDVESPFVFVRGSSRDAFNIGDSGYRDGEREFAHFFVRSNLSLAIEQGGDRSYLFASSFDGKDLPSDLSFEFYSYDGLRDAVVPNKQSKVSWNEKRRVYEIAKFSDVSFVIARSAKYFGAVALSVDAVSNYDFGYVSGQDSSTKDYAYVYGDRPIYRSGDSVHFKGLLRRFNPNGYVPSPLKDVKVRLVDQEGNALKEFSLKTDANSNFAASFDLPKEMKTGRYDFEIYAADPKNASDRLFVYNDGHFFVEQYVKPVFRVNASESERRDALPEEKVSVPFSAEYYFGGAVSMAPYSVSVMAQNYFFDPKEYSSYRFGTASSNYDCVYWGYCDNSDQFVAAFTGRLDPSGRGTVDYRMPKFESEDQQERLFSFNAEVTDPDTGKTVNSTVTKVLHKTDAYVGIRSPYWVSKGEAIRSEGVVLDWNAKPLSGKEVKVEFLRREWKEAKKLGIDGTYYSENELVSTSVKTVSATSDSEGKFTAEYRSESGGEFEIRVSYAGKNGGVWTSSEYAYVATDAYVSWGGTNNSVTELTAEKTVLKPGEKAVFTLKSPINSGKAFVTVEKDDAVLDVFVRDVSSYAERIEIPLESRHIPNAYVKAFLIGKPENSPLPVYKRALSVVKVLPDDRRLSVSVTADRDRKSPGEPLTVAVFVKDSLGNPVPNANGSLSVVDESVLALLGNPKKNPFAFFYEMKRYLGVATYLSLANLVDKLEVKSANLANGAKGGAGEDRKGGDAKKKRGTFKDTAFWRADFVTDKNGKFTVTTDALPDNLTTWVIEALVSTPSDNRIGIGSASVTTAQEVMVNDNLPRVFRTSDTVKLAPVVFNRTGADADFDVSLSSEALDVKKSVKKVRVKNAESAVVEFEVSAKPLPSGNGKSFAKILIEAKSGNRSDAVEKTVPVVRSETWESVTTVGSTSDASYDERLSLAGIDRERSELSVRYGASLFANAAEGLEYLLGYPYGCVEQKTSAVVPHLVLRRLAVALGTPFDIDKKTVPFYDASGRREKTVREVLSDYAASMASFRRADGGFGYWPEAQSSDFRMTAYVLSTLSDVRSAGIAVDGAIFAEASSYLKREFYANKRPHCVVGPDDRCGYPDSERLSAIRAVLSAKPDDYEAYKMWKLLDASKFDAASRVSALRTVAKVRQIPSLADADKAAIAKFVSETVDSILKTSLVYDPRGAYLATGTDSRVRTTAEFMEAVVDLGEDRAEIAGILDNVSRFLSRQKKSDGSFGSTLDTSATVSAFAARAKSDSAALSNFVARGSFNGKPVFETGIGKSDVTQTFVSKLPISGAPDASVANFSKTGNGKLYYDLSLSYPVPAEKIASRDEGFFVKTETYDLNDYRRVEALKNEEWSRYVSGSLRYAELKYPKDPYEYLSPISEFRVGQLVLVRYRVIAVEDRDRVAFESFVPSGAEIVNTRLSTESKTAKTATFFDREEFLDDRYFGYSEILPAGDYEGSYVFRATHVGSYAVPPSKAFEFYASEVFGRTEGKRSEIRSK